MHKFLKTFSFNKKYIIKIIKIIIAKGVFVNWMPPYSEVSKIFKHIQHCKKTSALKEF